MTVVDLRRARYFLAFAETLNFSSAARQLGVSQPALSKAISRLEEEIGGALIRREGRHTHLTHLGRLMREQFSAVDVAATRAELTAQRLVHGDMPQIQIAVMCTIGPVRVQRFLTAWRGANPDVEIVLRSASRDELGPMLLNGFVDCALVGAPIADEPRLKYATLYKESMVVACALDHRFAEAKSVALEEIMGEPYLDRLTCEFRDTFIEESERLGHHILFVVRSEREDWIQALVRAGLGVTIIPAESIILDRLVTRPITAPPIRRTVSLAVPYGREDAPLVRAFLSAARQFDWRRDE